MMRLERTVVCLVVAALLAGCAGQVAKPTSAKKRIAVLDFKDATDYGKGRLGKSAASMLETALASMGEFRVVNRSSLPELLQEQSLGQAGVAQGSAEAGRVTGVDIIITGTVSEFGVRKGGFTVPILFGYSTLGARATVDVQVVDASTSEILLTATGEGEDSDSGLKVLLIGSEGAYDETLARKLLRAAINEVADKVARAIDRS